MPSPLHSPFAGEAWVQRPSLCPAHPRGHIDCGRGAACPVYFEVQRTRVPVPRPRRCRGPRARAGNTASCCLPQAFSGEGLGRTGQAIVAKGQGLSRTCCGPEHLARGCEVRIEGPRGPDIGELLAGMGTRDTDVFHSDRSISPALIVSMSERGPVSLGETPACRWHLRTQGSAGQEGLPR